MDQLRALRYFSKVVQLGSFTQAAAEFSVPPSSLSRRVADLENHQGADLLKRSTRSVQVTEIGEIYIQQIQDVLRLLAHSDETVRSYQAKPMGQLRITSLVGFGEQRLLPALEDFKAQYPDVVLDVRLSDELTSLSRDDVDLAIRGGYAPNERVQAIRLMSNEFIPVAAPAYLAEMGVPQSVLATSGRHEGRRRGFVRSTASGAMAPRPRWQFRTTGPGWPNKRCVAAAS